jgi:hypothetical protein
MPEVGRQQRLWLKLTRRIADQYPTARDWHIPPTVPGSDLGVDFDYALLPAVPMIDLDLRSFRFRIVELLLWRRAARAFHAWASGFSGFSFGGWVVKLSIKSQPCDQIDSWRIADRIKQIQNGETAVADEDKMPIRRHRAINLPSAISQPLLKFLRPYAKQ